MQTRIFRQAALFAAILVSVAGFNPAYCQIMDEESSTDPETLILLSKLPLWKGSFTFGKETYKYTMVGTDPKLEGRHDSIIPVTLMPLVLTFPGTHIVSDATFPGVVDRVLQSPLFVPALFTEGFVELGPTQYLDAYQRANFWHNIDSTHDFHVWLQPSKVSVQHLSAPPTSRCPAVDQSGKVQIDWTVLDPYLRYLLMAYAKPNELTVFLLGDVSICNFKNGGGSGVVGYHSYSLTLLGTATYAVATYDESKNVSTLSHELGEWMANPLGLSKAPPWPDDGKCKTALEIGDPLSHQRFDVYRNGYPYHLQDLAFLSWFAHESPSSALNGWYSFKHLLPSPDAAICQPN